MKELRKNVAVSIDGGGYKGVMAAKALSMFEREVGKPCPEVFGLAAGTSTGSIISGSIAQGLSAGAILSLYKELGERIFGWSIRKLFWFASKYRYSDVPLEKALRKTIGEITLGELWTDDWKFDLVITVRDVVENKTLFMKPWKEEYADWPLWKAIMASSAVPTYFPVVDGRYVDGGFGSYANPCYIAAYEAVNCLGWKPGETTLISLGTGRDAEGLEPGEASKLRAIGWIDHIVDTFLDDANDQQVHLVARFFEDVDFRRVQVETRNLGFDDPSQYDRLVAYGEELGNNLLNDVFDTAPMRPATKAPGV